MALPIGKKRRVTRFTSGSSAETKRIAARIASRYAKRGKGLARVFGLVGDLGAGKTTFSQEFLRALGVRKKITSPTFVLVKRYPMKKKKGSAGDEAAYHIDAYRLHDAKELRALGFGKIVGSPDHVVLVEWADHVRRAMPKSTTWITFGHLKGDRRSIIMKH